MMNKRTDDRFRYAYKFRIYPNKEQEILIKCHYGLKKHSYYFGIWGCDEYSNYKPAVFIPALSDDTGIEYIYEEDIIGWMPIEDLDEIKVGE